MDIYITGKTIKCLREKKDLTQTQLADMLGVSSKAVSKWETAKGLPDVSLIEPLANALGVSVIELMSGNTVINKNPSSNILRSKFYVCPLCGNIIRTISSLLFFDSSTEISWFKASILPTLSFLVCFICKIEERKLSISLLKPTIS